MVWHLANDAACGLDVECDGDLGYEAEAMRKDRDDLKAEVERLREALSTMCNNALELGYCSPESCPDCSTTTALNSSDRPEFERTERPDGWPHA